MKKFVAIALLLTFTTTMFIGCGSEAEEASNETTETPAAMETTPAAETPAAETPAAPAADEMLTIGFAASDFNDKWLSYLYDAAKDEATKLGVELVMDDGKSDVNKQLAAVENFVNQDYDAIIINPVNTDASDAMIKACKEAGIPTVFVNRIPTDTSEITSYVGSESIEAGILEMEYVAEQMGGKGNIVILQGDPGNESAVKRTEGYYQVLEKYPDIKIVAEETAMWQRDKALTITETWLQSGLEFNAVVSNNDEMAIGALKAMESFGLTPEDVIVAGIDGTPDALQLVKDGVLDCTVFQNADAQGRLSVQTAVKAANGETVEPYVNVPFELVTPENVDEYMARMGM